MKYDDFPVHFRQRYIYNRAIYFLDKTLQRRAAAVVQEALRKKILKPASGRCVDCGEKAACYDHRYYSKPLDLTPVCYRCNSNRGYAFDYVLVSRRTGRRKKLDSHFSAHHKKLIKLGLAQ